MRLVQKDYVEMNVTFDNDIEKAFLLGAFSNTLYDFEIVEDGILQVDVPLEELQDFYDFLATVFNSFSLYV